MQFYTVNFTDFNVITAIESPLFFVRLIFSDSMLPTFFLPDIKHPQCLHPKYGDAGKDIDSSGEK